MTDLFGIEYVQGYTSALLDVKWVLEHIEHDLKLHNRRQNIKTMNQIIDCMIKNRAALREIPGAFVRCNDSVEGGFEVYVEGQGAYVPKTYIRLEKE